MAAEWTVEVTVKPGTSTQDDHKKLRHDPVVVAQLAALAEKVVAATGSPKDFEVLVQNDPATQRARAFAKPATPRGVRLELRESVLLKAVGSTGHSDLRSAPPSELTSAAGESQHFVVTPSGVRSE